MCSETAAVCLQATRVPLRHLSTGGGARGSPQRFPNRLFLTEFSLLTAPPAHRRSVREPQCVGWTEGRLSPVGDQAPTRPHTSFLSHTDLLTPGSRRRRLSGRTVCCKSLGFLDFVYALKSLTSFIPGTEAALQRFVNIINYVDKKNLSS